MVIAFPRPPASVAVAGREVDKTIRSLHNIAHPADITDDLFHRDYFAGIGIRQDDPYQTFTAQRAEEKVSGEHGQHV